jgi:uncharacterized protein (TIGR02646 family)
MVRTRRRPSAPPALRQCRSAWTARWKKILAAGRSGDWATQTAKRGLREPLLALTWGKCVFCEGKLGSQAYPQIEHYISRKVAPARAFQWTNLFPVCQICNTSKGHADHQGRLLKPDEEDPEPFFWIGPEGDIAPHPRLNTVEALRAAETIRLCTLNRGGLREDRFMVANKVYRWIDRATGFVNGLDEPAREEWEELSDPGHPHKVVIRHALTLRNAFELAATDRRFFQQGK